MTKRFTPTEATRTLPLVKAIVRDLLEKGRDLKTHAAKSELTATTETEDAIARLQEEIRDHLKELDQIGCTYRDWNFEVGLVDFPAVIDGEEVLLCWKSDEEKLEWFHGVNAGFAGRQRIPEELLEKT